MSDAGLLAQIARDRVAIGEVLSAVREMRWWPAIARERLPEDVRERLDGTGVLGPLRLSAAARRLMAE